MAKIIIQTKKNHTSLGQTILFPKVLDLRLIGLLK